MPKEGVLHLHIRRRIRKYSPFVFGGKHVADFCQLLFEMRVRKGGKDRVSVAELSLASEPGLESMRPTRRVPVDMHRDEEIGIGGVTQVDPRLKLIKVF